MKTKDILNLPKNESSLSIAKSYLQSTTLNIKEQEKLFLFILGILNELDRYQELLADGKEYLSQIYEPNETYTSILKYLFDAALKLEQFDLAKNYLNNVQRNQHYPLLVDRHYEYHDWIQNPLLLVSIYL